MQVAERGLQFVHTFAHLLAEQQAASVVPGLFREAWAFSACISLATTTSRLMGATTALNKKPPEQPSSPVITQQHRYSFACLLTSSCLLPAHAAFALYGSSLSWSVVWFRLARHGLGSLSDGHQHDRIHV